MLMQPRFTLFMLGPAIILWMLFAGLAPLAAAVGRTLPGRGVLAYSTPTDPRTEWHIMLMDVRTRIAHRIGWYGWRIPLPMEWSPDGTRLAYATAAQPSDIYIYDLNTGKTTNLTQSFAEDRYPTWSPDGARLLFFSNALGQFDIYSIAPDGTDRIQLTSGEGILPAFSPDGTQILFSGSTKRNLFVMNADGSDVRRITQGPRMDRNVVWSPDGAWAAFIGFINGTEQRNGHFVFMLDMTCLRVSDCAAQPVLVWPGFRFQGMPQWSPDGRYLVFVAQTLQDDTDAIYLMDMMQPSEPRKLVSDVYYVYAERWSLWSPDSRYIAYSQRSRPGLYILDVQTGAVEKLSDQRTAYPSWRP
jgi:Tol biopolymer transport system component